jgi:hypothetical protein
MARICTFTRDLGNTVEAMTSAEWSAGGKLILDTEADEWVWQEAETKEAAVARHDAAHAAWHADTGAGRPERATY